MKAPKPPFGQHRDDNSLTFSGDNTEVWGYVLWYKDVGDIDFFVCEYNGEVKKPTIIPGFTPEINATPPWTILFKDLGHQILPDNFKVLLDSEMEFQFAVSSYGINGEESEKVIF